MKIARILLAATFTLAPLVASAAVSQKYREWGDGPDKWIMTREEARAWKQITTDEAAVDFIDLFWARRDPTPGTPRNETREELASRVALADIRFKHRQGNSRGSMTDRGRIYVVFGPATSMGEQGESTTAYIPRRITSEQAGGEAPGADPTAGRRMGEKDVWEWRGEDALRFGLGRFEVHFIADPYSGNFKRDPVHGEIMAAMPKAIALLIANPGLTTLPEWAMRGGLEPYHTVVKKVEAKENAPLPANVVLPSGEPGASRLTLVRDVFAISTHAKTDLFASMASVGTFSRQEEVGWAARYCSDAALETLTVGLKISGTVGGERVTMTAEPEETRPDRIRAMANCYLVRGAVPTADMEPGTYDLEVTITDPATQQSQSLQSRFTVQ